MTNDEKAYRWLKSYIGLEGANESWDLDSKETIRRPYDGEIVDAQTGILKKDLVDFKNKKMRDFL